MSKKQKILLAIFFALFALPELLWSPVVNFYYEFWQGTKYNSVSPMRDNFLQTSDNIWFLKLVLVIQLLMLLAFWIFYLLWKKNKKVYDWLLLFILFVAGLLTLFAVYFALTFSIEIL